MAVCAGDAGGFLAGAVASTLRRSPRLMATPTLTFLFTDIEASTAMVQRLGDAWAGVLADHHRLIRAGVTAHGGEEVITPGDGVFAVFASPRACCGRGGPDAAGTGVTCVAGRRAGAGPDGHPLRCGRPDCGRAAGARGGPDRGGGAGGPGGGVGRGGRAAGRCAAGRRVAGGSGPAPADWRGPSRADLPAAGRGLAGGLPAVAVAGGSGAAQ